MNKTILITGGTGKVGLQLVNHFLTKEFTVITTTRDKAKFFDTHPLLSNYTNLKILDVDFNQTDAIATIIEYCYNNQCFPNHIIYNARSIDTLKIESDKSVSRDNFMREFFIDVVFPYELSMKIIQHQIPENIIFISSIYGVVAPNPALYDNFHSSSPINYGVCKAAQIHLTKELAVRLSPDTRVNCISFGGIKGRVTREFIDKYSSLNPQGKMLEEEDVIAPVDFLVSEGSKNMTGQNIIVDGGWTIW